MRRRAFTIVELLTVIGVISMLMGMLMPAIQKVRAAADRMRCASNLHQIGIALHLFHNDHQRFPPGVTSDRPGEPFPRMTWLTRILPYIEQDTLWGQSISAYTTNRNFMANPPHEGFSTPIKLYSCPADERVSSAQVTFLGLRPALTSYVGVLGTSFSKSDGVLYRDSRTRITDIYDGSSNTIIVGERPPSANFWYGWWYAGVGQQGTGSLDMLLGASEQNSGWAFVSHCPPGPYQFGPGKTNNMCDTFHFWSLHPNGAHFLCADGSVHFITYNVLPTLIPALATRNGGEIETID